MKAEERLEPGGLRLILEEDVDMHAATDLQKALQKALDRKPRALVLDLARVGFIDSAGLAVIIAGLKRARQASIAFQVQNLSGQVRDTFEIAGLTRILGIE